MKRLLLQVAFGFPPPLPQSAETLDETALSQPWPTALNRQSARVSSHRPARGGMTIRNVI